MRVASDSDHQAAPLGWCDFGDVYRRWLRLYPEDATIVEVGSYLGQSAVGWGRLAERRGVRTKLICIDPWLGVREAEIIAEEGRQEQRALLAAHGGSMRPAFEANIDRCGVRPWIEVREGYSVEQAATFADGSVHAVMIDGDHAPASVWADLKAWWPKVAPGGEMVGHDDDWPSVHDTVRAWAAEVGVQVVPASARCWRVRKPAPGEGWTVPAGARSCLVAVASNERTIMRETVKSLMALGWGLPVLQACHAHGFADVKFTWVDRYATVDAMREEAALMALKLGCSHLLFLDADMTWPADLLTRMLAHHDRGVVSGIYHLKVWPHKPVAFAGKRWNERDGCYDYTYDLDAIGATGLRPQDLIGLGCALIPTRVFEQMPRPWFAYARNQRTGLTTITEDVWFCEQAAEHGVPILLDPTIQCGHVGTPVISHHDAQRAAFDVAYLERGLIPPLPHELPVEMLPPEGVPA